MLGLVTTILSGVSSEKEVVCLQRLGVSLSPNSNDNQEFALPTTENNKENDGLELDFTGNSNPFPHFKPEVVCTSQEELNQFFYYVFDRRFGWSETNTEDGRRVRRLSSTGVVLSAGDGHQKAVLNTYLDCLIKWFLYQDLDESVLLALKFTIKQAGNMPVVRNRAVIHTMDWVKRNHEQLCDNADTSIILELIVISLTDVWSAIRNACASRLGNLISAFNLQDTETLFSFLVKVCCDESSWQGKEGAVMGINAILQRFQHSTASKSPLSSPRTLDLETEMSQVNSIPQSISEKIHSVVFTLLSHSQLTIREQAAKTLATYITCSSIMDALSTLNEVVSILWKGSETVNTAAEKGAAKFLDDYAAEGFLGVCIFLVKVLPLCYLLPGWPEYVSTFLRYISHPASTVRQAASTVFKYLVVKSSHSVVVLKLILQALAMNWNPDTDHMTEVISPVDVTTGHSWPSVRDSSGCALSDTWEGREGRLFAYELIFKYLIKNHWLYTFGPAGSGINAEDKSVKEAAERQNGGPVSSPRPDTTVKANHERPVHHVESEKSLAVKFLTQAEIHVPDILEDRSRTKPLERLMTVGNKEERYFPIRSRHSPTSGSQHDTTFSLLTLAQSIDTSNLEVPEEEQAHVRQQLQLQSLKTIVETNKNSLGSKCNWMEKEYLQDMSRILKVILYQTAESIGDSQWELRRIANQVLPCLAEVIRWYDVNILVAIWNSYLYQSAPTCLMTFTSVLLLKESMIHAVKLILLLHKPPHSWQDHDRCRDCLSVIIDCIQARLPQYLPYMEQLVQRTCCDRLSVLAADVILMSHEHFNIPSEQKSSHYSSVLDFWKKVFYFAHPQTRISTALLESELKDEEFSSPFEGYLSCCLVRPDSKVQCARQVEKQFISEVHSKLHHFLLTLTPSEVVKVTPIVAHYIGLLIDDSHTCKTMLECLNSITDIVIDHINEQTDTQIKHSHLKCVQVTLKELAAIVTMKSMDLPQVQKILGVYQQLCKLITPSRHLRVIFTAISARLNETVQFSLENSPRPGHDTDDLYLLDNDIPASFSLESESDSDPEEVRVGTPSSNRFPESLTLNTSNNSGTMPSGRLSALSSHSNDGGHVTSKGSLCSEEDSSSDWDSWDDEEESQSAFSEIFSDFLKTLQKTKNYGGSEFMSEVKKLGDREKTVILGLLKT